MSCVGGLGGCQKAVCVDQAGEIGAGTAFQQQRRMSHVCLCIRPLRSAPQPTGGSDRDVILSATRAP